MSNYNRVVENMVRFAWVEHALKGFHKVANYQKEGMWESFSLFDRVECEAPYYYIANEWIKEHLDPAGIYTKKRKLELFEPLRKMLLVDPWTEKDLKVGQKFWAKALPQISKHYRQGEIGGIDMISDGIVDAINCSEEHGYQDTYGSFYVYELIIIKDGDNWHPFDSIWKGDKE